MFEVTECWMSKKCTVKQWDQKQYSVGLDENTHAQTFPKELRVDCLLHVWNILIH